MTLNIQKESVILRDGKYFFQRVLFEEHEVSPGQLNADIQKLNLDITKFSSINKAISKVKDPNVEVLLD